MTIFTVDLSFPGIPVLKYGHCSFLTGNLPVRAGQTVENVNVDFFPIFFIKLLLKLLTELIVINSIILTK